MKLAPAILAAAVLVLVSPAAPSQIIIHAESAWVGPPFPMGDYDSQVVPVVAGMYTGPVNPPGACFILPPGPGGPFGGPGPTLWHTEVDCCAAGAGPPPGWGPTFAAYNSAGGGLVPYTYLTGAGGIVTANAGALCSYGIAGVSFRLPSPIGLGQLIVLCFDYVKDTEGGGITAFDTAFVEVRPAPCGEPAAVDGPGSPPWTAISVIPGNVPCGVPTTCCIGPFNPALDGMFITPPGAPVGGKIRFRFNTGDATSNMYCGWSVDNVVLTNEECVPSCPGAVSPTIGNVGGEAISPNPAYGITLSGAPPGSFAALNISPGNVPATPIPFPGGCLVCCPPFIVFPAVFVPLGGAVTLPVPIPAGIPPCVSEVCVQWYILAPPTVLTSSAGKVRFQIG
ncbi:MAG TPA: hypothetical protein VFI25_11950 [Planctomycetota bacterium]|jgi:hypothetical protein|nr:hypothetical protein [Planctomycetota bacterium]